jgi:hypothetical protein
MNTAAKDPGVGRGREVMPTKSTTVVGRFAGTDNPRHLRAIQGLLTRPTPRQTLDQIAGCSNGPELVAELRRRGLEIPCDRIDAIDRDGRPCRPGVYHLTDADRRRLNRWLHTRQSGAVDAGLVVWLLLLGIVLLMVLEGPV